MVKVPFDFWSITYRFYSVKHATLMNFHLTTSIIGIIKTIKKIATHIFYPKTKALFYFRIGL